MTPLTSEVKGLTIDEDNLEFSKSTFSGGNDSCVNVALVDGGAVVRDSKDAAGPKLVFTNAEWDAFLAGAHAGEFNTK